MDKYQRKLFLLIISLIFLSGYLLFRGFNLDQLFIKQPNPNPISSPKNNAVSGTIDQPAPITNGSTAQVIRVVDGDTVEVRIDDQIYKIRYIGINTPETVDPRRKVECFGKEASNENKKTVEGKKVILEKDVSETDKYGRLLRYVYLKMEDGNLLFVNDYLVREGFAYALTYPPDVKYNERFLQAEKEAKQNNKGLWASCI